MNKKLLQATAQVIIPLGVILLLEYLFRESLFLKTLEDIPRMQEKARIKPFFQ